METHLTILTGLLGVGVTLIFSLPFVIPMVIGKAKKVKRPLQFGFVCWSIALGAHVLISFAFIPIAVLYTFALPQYCADDPNMLLCNPLSFNQEIFETSQIVLFVFLVIYVPIKLAKEKWPAYIAGLEANQTIKSDEMTAGGSR